MGSKKIKAVVVEKASTRAEFEYADKEKFSAALKKFMEICKVNPRIKMFNEVGTAYLLNITGPLSIVPRRNFSGLPLTEEQKAAFTTENWKEAGTGAGGKTGVPCQPGCVMKCSNIYHGKNGEFLTAGFEYETIGMFGPNLDIYDFHAIAKFDYLCDDMGIDTIEAGCVMGLCMEAGKIEWGNTDGVTALLEEMRCGTEFGRLLGQGAGAAGKALGVANIPAVKSQAIPAYDPRKYKGNGITYAVSTQGADHTFGVVAVPTATDEEIPGLAIESQTKTALANDFMCQFLNVLILEDPSVVPDLYAGAFGGEWTMEQCRERARETIKTERIFNERAGFTAADDRLPDFFRKAGYEGGPMFHYSDEQVQMNINAIYPYK
jgi:aldehyde:ferredoxin oxidoreductase